MKKQFNIPQQSYAGLQMDDNLIKRKVKNIGTNAVKISCDLNHLEYLAKYKKSFFKPAVLRPDEELLFHHWYVIIETDDKNNATLRQTFLET